MVDPCPLDPWFQCLCSEASTTLQDEAGQIAQSARNLLFCDEFRSREGDRVSGTVPDSDDEEVQLCVWDIVHELLGENGIIDSIEREDVCLALDKLAKVLKINGMSPWIQMVLHPKHPFVRQPRECLGRQAHPAYSYAILRGRCVCVCVCCFCCCVKIGTIFLGRGVVGGRYAGFV